MFIKLFLIFLILKSYDSNQLFSSFALAKDMSFSKDVSLNKEVKRPYEKKEDLNTKNAFDLAISNYNLSIQNKGNIKLSKKTLHLFNQAQNLYIKEHKSKNPEIEAYTGSTYTLIARDSKKIKDKIYNTNLGISYLDKAVRRNKNHLNIRLIRLSTNIGLPARFKRKSKIIEDITYITKNDLSNHKSLIQRAYYFLGQFEKDKELRKEFFSKSHSLDPKSKIGKKAKDHVDHVH